MRYKRINIIIEAFMEKYEPAAGNIFWMMIPFSFQRENR